MPTSEKTRKQILDTRRAAHADGRYLLEAEQSTELVRRATVRYLHEGCSVQRVMRLNALVIQQRKRVIAMLALLPVEGAKHYLTIIDDLARLHTAMEWAAATAALDQVCRNIAAQIKSQEVKLDRDHIQHTLAERCLQYLPTVPDIEAWAEICMETTVLEGAGPMLQAAKTQLPLARYPEARAVMQSAAAARMEYLHLLSRIKAKKCQKK